MNANAIKTPMNLTWKSMVERYPITTIKVEGKQVEVNALKDAIEDGTLLAEVEAAAKEQGVETYDMLRQMSRLLSSNLVNIRKRYDSPSKTKDLARCEMLREFVKANMVQHNNSKTAGNGKAKWKYTAEEIADIPLSDVKLLKSIRDCMASKLCKYPDDITVEFHTAYAFACERYSAARKANDNRAEAQHATTVFADLNDTDMAVLKKLGIDGKLSKADKAALRELIQKLTADTALRLRFNGQEVKYEADNK